MAVSYHPTEAIALLKPVFRHLRVRTTQFHTPRASFTTSHTPRATHRTSTSSHPSNPGPTRRSVTVINDTGSVQWGQLSPGEKAARTTQQSLNFIVVAVGVVLTGTISYLLFTDVFSPTSKTAYFNRSHTLIRSSPAIQSLLGPSDSIRAYGESSWSRMARNRFLSANVETDKWGTEHMRFRFFVEGDLGMGTAHVHLVRRPGDIEYVYEELSVDVKGHRRIYLESKEEKKGKVAPKIFGARWW
ncbi:TIM21-domain-containing protein [Pleomassaria siparia CBS 279.74]|uniref:Mitochondrial import inner membrane translocase subunit Tim21 n=1 Tax=Pleomassaria siparia CBS 279.74 TaxID=1314801 RepID=A0A6G1JZG6_9PLEO|nr:TIM21-domain-containing protein [Pleomassaria siparia CBS 279.74]